jgi:hypothetical protein
MCTGFKLKIWEKVLKDKNNVNDKRDLQSIIFSIKRHDVKNQIELYSIKAFDWYVLWYFTFSISKVYWKQNKTEQK